MSTFSEYKERRAWAEGWPVTSMTHHRSHYELQEDTLNNMEEERVSEEPKTETREPVKQEYEEYRPLTVDVGLPKILVAEAAIYAETMRSCGCVHRTTYRREWDDVNKFHFPGKVLMREVLPCETHLKEN